MTTIVTLRAGDRRADLQTADGDIVVEDSGIPIPVTDPASVVRPGTSGDGQVCFCLPLQGFILLLPLIGDPGRIFCRDDRPQGLLLSQLQVDPYAVILPAPCTFRIGPEGIAAHIEIGIFPVSMPVRDPADIPGSFQYADRQPVFPGFCQLFPVIIVPPVPESCGIRRLCGHLQSHLVLATVGADTDKVLAASVLHPAGPLGVNGEVVGSGVRREPEEHFLAVAVGVLNRTAEFRRSSFEQFAGTNRMACSRLSFDLPPFPIVLI